LQIDLLVIVDLLPLAAPLMLTMTTITITKWGLIIVHVALLAAEGLVGLLSFLEYGALVHLV